MHSNGYMKNNANTLAQTCSAHWISPVQESSKAYPYENAFSDKSIEESKDTLQPAQYLRRIFYVKKEVSSATLSITSHGFYHFSINGFKKNNNILTPEVTPFHQRLLYQTYDVSDCLSIGKNVLAVVLTDGWHISRIGLVGEGCQYADKLALWCMMKIIYQDGTEEMITSDEAFVSNTGPIVYSDIFIGERYDARLELTDWQTIHYDDHLWKPVNIITSNELLEKQSFPYVEKHECFIGKKVDSDQHIYDFGQVIAGRVKLKMKAHRGVEVKIEHSEILSSDNTFMRNIIGQHKDQRDYYIFKGNDIEEYEPIGTYHGFRYIKISGNVEVLEVKAYALYTSNHSIINFNCDNNKINQLWNNIDWSLKGNMISIPTDCPQRERSGFTGDAQIIMSTLCWFYDVKDFITSWLKSVRIEQHENGEVPTIVPNFPAVSKFMQKMGGIDTSIGWGDAIIIIPWTLYCFYGDITILIENYEAMKKWITFVENWAKTGYPYDNFDKKERENHKKYILDQGFSFGDWLIPSVSKGLSDPMATANETKGPINTAYFAYISDLMSKIAEILKHIQDKIYYENLNKSICDAYTKEYYLGKGKIKGKYQGIYVTALAFNVLPINERVLVAEKLVQMIKENDNRLDTGFLSINYLLPVLTDFGYADVALDLFYQEKCPSWLYEVNSGATTIWESWNAIDEEGTIHSSSLNHFAFGCVGDWMIRYLVGIKPITPGFKTILISPMLDCKLNKLSVTYKTVNGKISISWTRFHRHIEMIIELSNKIKGRFQYKNILKELDEYNHFYIESI